MPNDEELVELKFRLYDGTDIGPFRYSPASTVAMLKERIVSDWPKADYKLSVSIKNGGRDRFFINVLPQYVGIGLSISPRDRNDLLVIAMDDKKIAPKGANDVKLINAGKILENSKTVGQCRIPFGELTKGIITMHVVVQPSIAKVKTEKKIDEASRKNICGCSIL